MTSFFKYGVNWYNEYKGEEMFDQGIVCAGSFVDAVKYILEEYGETNVTSVSVEDAAVEGHCFSMAEMKGLFKEDDHDDL